MAIYGNTLKPVTLTRRPALSRFREDVLAGLRRAQREIPCKYLYDERGSELFDRICEQPEYYLTRTELAIMRRYAGEMAEVIGPGCRLIEFGSGNILKTPLLLEQLEDPVAYVPVDISREQLFASARALGQQFPHVQIAPVWADFTQPFDLSALPAYAARDVVYFPGSTIGDFGPDEAIRLLEEIGEIVGPSGGLLVGVDLRKEAHILEAAYNDEAGVTAAFNLNLLDRINREIGANFVPEAFEHVAFFDDEHSRIEMHVVSLWPQTVKVGATLFEFDKDDSIRTECSYKYSLDMFGHLADEAGFTVDNVWTDSKRLFSVQYLARR
jgi:dimethylhistidine N-methyltransferase